MKKYKQAPLPFQGQKRRFIKDFEKALHEYPSNGVYVDLFGGSGLLSHTVKRIYPNSTVIYNDFDDYHKRLEAIPQTNAILNEIRALNLETTQRERITGREREAVLNVLKRAEERGFVDWITISSCLRFSMNYGFSYEDFKGDTLYNRLRTSNYEPATDYLQGVEIVKFDYKTLFEQYKYVPNVVFLIDPPYLSTDTATYNSTDYWKLSDYLNVLDCLHGQSYFYFTSNKSQIVELCEWLETRTSDNANPFKGANISTTANAPSGNTKFTDVMYHIKR
ncbi:DNA adenine methylase [Capnocytophaga canis]|uniref:DNA adenine methylase n=1 Tax=Capnocytophaga canis TaxID=1848903 RepID=UPI0037CF0A6F